MQWLKTLFPILFSLCIGLVGAVVLRFLHAPMPWLLGSILAIILASRFTSLPISSPKRLSAPSRAILGITIGSAFKPEILCYLGDFISSLVLILPFVLVTTLSGVWYYVKVLKFDIYTAFLALFPAVYLRWQPWQNLFDLIYIKSSRPNLHGFCL